MGFDKDIVMQGNKKDPRENSLEHEKSHQSSTE